MFFQQLEESSKVQERLQKAGGGIYFVVDVLRCGSLTRAHA